MSAPKGTQLGLIAPATCGSSSRGGGLR
jgi:hypothetical protein